AGPQRAAARAAFALPLPRGVESHHRHGHVGRVGGHARIRVADDREVAVVALDGGTAGARLALVARLGHVLEVRAARALEQVAADGREVAQLPEAPESSAADS